MSERWRPFGRVLVTGASGFLGRALALRLRAEGIDVVETDLQGNADAGIMPLDLVDFDAVEACIAASGCETLFHCGAVSGPMVLADRPLAIWQVNAAGSTHVFEAARRSSVGRLVHCSPIDVYGPQAEGIVDEAARLDPETIYGASKAAAEQSLLGYCREHGLEAVALRLSWIYGPGRQTPTTLTRLVESGFADAPISIDDTGGARTHYIHIDDAVAGVLAAAAALHLPESAYNITAGSGLPLSRVVEALRRVFPKLDVAYGNPGEDDGEGPSGFDQARAARDLGFEAMVDIDAGISRTVEALCIAARR